MDNRDYYEILGVSRDATTENIRAQFKKLLLLHHPDKLAQKNSDPSSKEVYLINEAWKVLVSPEKRISYDRALAETDFTCVGVQISLSDMSFDPCTETYSMECRCSGKFFATLEDIQAGISQIPCESCSICAELVHNIN